MIITAIATLAVADIETKLKPVSPGAETGSLRWSPKGAQITLKKDGNNLVGSFSLGLKGSKQIQVQLSKTVDAKYFDHLSVDMNRDGMFSEDEVWKTTPNERTGKWWSSFATSDVPVPVNDHLARPYPISFWYVEDPLTPDAAPLLRWSRRGWHEGTVDIDGKPAYVLITEMVMDGQFDQRDAWFIARSRNDLLAALSRGMEDHAWLDGKAYRLTKIDPSGLTISFQSFDPGWTQAEEEANRDTLAPDKAARKAEKPVPFSHDYEAAMTRSSQEKKRVLIDFEATWCGPCKTMDELVYTAQDVVNAASGIVCVKVDGDERRDLTEKFNVGAYPTMILLDENGKEIGREVGYRSVNQMVAFLKKK
ncbi:MAG: thioredoxin family protein [Armatimonadetes bacterium]|nr:thioredoxin family protein [Armatimonadota bacterium]